MSVNRTRSENVRALLDTNLRSIPVNVNFNVGEVAARISTRSRNVEPRTVGIFLRERQDVKHIGNGVWRRIPLAAEAMDLV